MSRDQVPTLILPDDANDEVASLLGVLQELVFRHPVAAQALFRAFVAEGRAFARTDEGKRWAERLASSDLVRQGRVAWDAVSLNALDDRADTVFPTAVLDAFAKAIASVDLHGVLGAMLEQSVLFTGEDSYAG